ncbi:MAG: amino acid adenylation domain-containing protein [Maritimibacter sp.]|nr:amino acid adenylation domain-containing protein [Maritimibacter sp.]
MKDIELTSGTGFALSPMQAWMHYESAPTGRPWMHVIQAVVHLEASVPKSADFAQAWAAAANAHPALRSTIQWRKRTRPEQHVAETVTPTIDEIDWQARSADVQHSDFAAFLAANRARGVEFETSPPWRVTLIRLAPSRAIMVVTSHNALTDATSLGIILRDVFAVLDRGAPVAPARSADLLRRLYDRIAEAPPEDARAYFAEYLAGYEPLGLTATRAETKADLRPVIRAAFLDAATTTALTTRAAALGGTPQSLVEAAWGLVMMRWYNLSDIVIGVTRPGRDLLRDANDAAGCFINTLPIRIRAGRDTRLGDLVARLAGDAEAMRPYDQVSAAEIRRMGGVHGASYLFDSVLQVDDGSFDTQIRRSAATWTGRRAELFYEVDMPFSVSAYADTEMKLELEFDPGLVKPAQGERMLAHLATLLAAIADADADTPVQALDMMTPAERAELLALGEPAQEAAPFDLLDRFAEAVARDPDAIAVQSAGQPGSLSYAELEARSTALAAVLQKGGAAPGEIVAINLGRSLDYIVTLFAVLKTGAAFVPVDPSYPDAVKAHMVTDSAARLVVTLGDLPAIPGATAVRPDARPGDATFAPVRRDPEGLCYVIYTSGSTGVPKGVMIPDRALATHNAATTRYFGLTPEDRVFQFISLSFDFSLEEIMPTLLVGATLILRSDVAAGSAPDFLRELNDVLPTVVHLPTAFYHIVADFLLSSGERLPDCVRLMNTGGERINPKIVRAWVVHQPEVRTLNGYGPTEAAITCTYFELTPDLPEGDIPIGSATDHARLYIAAPDGSLAPRGATGELWIGGPSVGLGYLGLPEKTDDVFLDDAFRGQGRVYRSGDRAAWRADGEVDFFGRKDRQVKVRGFRIDLGHVESVLEKAQPDLRVLAAVREAGTPAARLLAWAMLPEGGAAAVDLDALNGLAQSGLSPQMRPQIVAVDDFPRAAGGKIDVKALPEPGRPAPRAAAGDDAPMTELEAKIAGLMTLTLGGINVGALDNFYDLGGHSLLAAELVGRVETELGARISVLDLQRDGTARGIANVVQVGSTGPRHISQIQPSGTRPPLFGIHILGPSDSYYTGLAAELGDDQPILGVTIGAVAADQPTGVEATAKRYFDEIQEFYPDGPVNIVAVSLGAYFAWELVCLLRAAGREIGHFGLFDADGPLGRAQVTGWRRMVANLQTIRHRGLRSIPVALYHRYYELQHRRIAARMKALQEEGGEITIRSGSDFIAMNDLAVEEFEPKPLDVPVTIYRSNENFFDTRASKNSGLGWAPVAKGGYKVIDVPGGHLTMLDYPHVTVLAKHIARALKG